MRPGVRAESMMSRSFPASADLAEWFGDQLHAGIQPSLMDDRVARISGGEKHLQVRPFLSGLLGQLPAVHAARQPDVGEKDAYFGMGLPESAGRNGPFSASRTL